MPGASPDAAYKEGKTIVQVASLFNQLLQHFPRTEFAALVKKRDAERAAKGFTCWSQFVAMLFVNSDAPIRCARSATAWDAAWDGWGS